MTADGVGLVRPLDAIAADERAAIPEWSRLETAPSGYDGSWPCAVRRPVGGTSTSERGSRGTGKWSTTTQCHEILGTLGSLRIRPSLLSAGCPNGCPVGCAVTCLGTWHITIWSDVRSPARAYDVPRAGDEPACAGLVAFAAAPVVEPAQVPRSVDDEHGVPEPPRLVTPPKRCTTSPNPRPIGLLVFGAQPATPDGSCSPLPE